MANWTLPWEAITMFSMYFHFCLLNIIYRFTFFHLYFFYWVFLIRPSLPKSSKHKQEQHCKLKKKILAAEKDASKGFCGVTTYVGRLISISLQSSLASISCESFSRHEFKTFYFLSFIFFLWGHLCPGHANISWYGNLNILKIPNFKLCSVCGSLQKTPVVCSMA